MAKNQQPLLTSSRPSTPESNDRHEEEEDALLTGQPKPPSKRYKYSWPFWREVGLFTWATVATALFIILAVLFQHNRETAHLGHCSKDVKLSGKRNLIFMVSDGMGPTSLSLTRSFRQTQLGLPASDVLVLDQHLIGQSRTRSSSSLITDSAAGATAFSCGKKSYNGAISVLPDHSPCGTVLEAAKRAGYTTGLVVTTRLTDATPACFAAHVNRRDEEDTIAEQMVGIGHPLGRMVDLLMGGGRCHFLSNSTVGSCRGDEKDVRTMAEDDGWSYVSDRKAFDGLKLGSAVELPLLGLFAHEDIPYEVDRRTMEDTYPSLDQMTKTALRALSDATKDGDQGFFLMIEGSRIDHAGHGNDPVAQVHEVLAYDKAFASVLEFLDKDPVQGVLVGTSDHETGGLATARQLHDRYPIYQWYPDVLLNSSHSSAYLAYALAHARSQHPDWSSDALAEHVRTHFVEDGLGVYDATDEEIDRLVDNAHDPWPASYVFADIISRRAQVGWSTHGHSAVDVNIYASEQKHVKALIGNHENTEVGKFLRDYLNVDVDDITKELKEKGMASFLGHQWVDGQTHLEPDHYAGDFKRSLNCGCGNVR
ncbi:hypothetical protein MMC21_000675 [Puttea exsequens]|nr:hypothetical protein [Puttea exsequens]